MKVPLDQQNLYSMSEGDNPDRPLLNQTGFSSSCGSHGSQANNLTNVNSNDLNVILPNTLVDSGNSKSLVKINSFLPVRDRSDEDLDDDENSCDSSAG